MTRPTGHTKLVQGKRGKVWYVRYRLPSGRQVQKVLGPAWPDRSRPPAGYYTKKTAQDALGTLLAQAREGTLPDSRPTGRTFKEACAEYLRYCEVDKDAKPSTLHGYRSVNKILMDEFGADTPLEKVTAERIDAYRAGLLSGGKMKRRTVQKLQNQLHAILKRAKRLKWVAVNAAEDVERVRVMRSGDFNVLTPAEVEAVARATAADADAALIRVAAYTGLRQGELRALRWRDVDFTLQNVFVRLNRPTHGGVSTPKSHKIRSVPLIDEAAVALDTLSRREAYTRPDDLVFATELGNARSDTEIRDTFYDALDDAGFGHLRTKSDPMVFHDLRHVFGTLAVQVWPLTDVQAYMGHADIQTTMRYVHHVPRVRAAAELGAAVQAALSADETLPRNVLRTAENGAQLSAPTFTVQAVNALAKTA